VVGSSMAARRLQGQGVEHGARSPMVGVCSGVDPGWRQRDVTLGVTARASPDVS